MSTPPISGIRQPVLQARETWNHQRKAIRQLHDEGAAGKQTTRALSDLLDQIVLELHRAALGDLGTRLDDSITLVMHGGCGRQEFSPFSDVDLMILYQGSMTAPLEEYSRRIIQDINDVGLRIGNSLRTPREACTMATHDAQVFSSLAESRYLAGNNDLFTSFLSRLQRIAQKRHTGLVQGILAARAVERNQFGETVYLLRPNIKRSPGDLRDVHLIRWLGFVRFGQPSIDSLVDRRALTANDAAQLHTANDFLLRLRCDLHFHAGRTQDQLGRNEQVRIAQKFGYQGTESVLPVEAMMQDYFRLTSQVRYLSEQFSAATLNRTTLTQSMLAPLMTRQIDGIFRMGPTRIGVDPERCPEVCGNIQQILRLMQLAVLHNKSIEQETWLAIREAMSRDDVVCSQDDANQFWALLGNSHRLAETLQMLHEMHVLEKIIPDFSHARGLLQFNEYHHYTVDEHSLRAVHICTEFENDEGTPGKVYRQLRERQVLHLALLLHDLGKGYPVEHCEVGREIAIRICQRLGMDSDDAENVRFLVHNHLMMSHIAFHRDISDQSMVAEFAANVGSIQLLSMLFLLTWSDISAVGPGMMTPWKSELLTTLYTTAHDQMTGQSLNEKSRLGQQSVFQRIADTSSDPAEREWLLERASSLPWNYCSEHEPEMIAERLLMMRDAAPAEIFTFINPVASTGQQELSIAKREKIRSGIFYKVTGMLASQGLRVKAAEIKPLGQSLLWYWFRFDDADFSESPESRLEEIRVRASEIASGAEIQTPRFRSLWNDRITPAVRVSLPEIRVEIDNQTVDNATIIDVFAYNRLGLLYTISRKIYLLGLDVRFARISTWGHQVLDVFYVTDSKGQKLRDRLRLNTIRLELLEEVENFLSDRDRDSS